MAGVGWASELATCLADLATARTQCQNACREIAAIHNAIDLKRAATNTCHDPVEVLQRTGRYRFRAILLEDSTGFASFESSLSQACSALSSGRPEEAQRAKLLSLLDSLCRTYLTLGNVAHMVREGRYDIFLTEHGERKSSMYTRMESQNLLQFFWREHKLTMAVLGGSLVGLAFRPNSLLLRGMLVASVGAAIYNAVQYHRSPAKQFLQRVGVDLRYLPQQATEAATELEGLIAVSAVIMSLVEQSYKSTAPGAARHCVLLGVPELQGSSPADWPFEARQRVRSNYRNLSRCFHPDRNASPIAHDLQAVFNEAMDGLETAWRTAPARAADEAAEDDRSTAAHESSAASEEPVASAASILAASAHAAASIDSDEDGEVQSALTEDSVSVVGGPSEVGSEWVTLSDTVSQLRGVLGLPPGTEQASAAEDLRQLLQDLSARQQAATSTDIPPQ